jgi:hypothetical protein
VVPMVVASGTLTILAFLLVVYLARTAWH